MKTIDQRRFVLFLSVLVGLSAGIGAVIIKNSAHTIENWVEDRLFHEYYNVLYFLFPFLGLLLTVLIIKYVIKKDIGHGIPNALYAISRKKSVLKAGQMWYSVITSAITVGFGGSTGLEGPTVATGAAVGSNIGKVFRMNYKVRTLLIGCAAASSMAAIFQAPVAAIVFVLEVFMFDLTMYSIIPLLISSITAVITSRYFLGEIILFPTKITDALNPSHIIFYVLLGVLTGLFSLYFNKVYFGVKKLFSEIKNPFHKAIYGGIGLGLLIFILPPLYGEGYETINQLINDNTSTLLNRSMFFGFGDNFYVLILFVLAFAFFKILATAFTFSGGGIGGVFAPSLFMGAAIGFVMAKVIVHFGIADLPVTHFALVGMAGLIAGVLHAPLMAMFLIAEITGGYELFVPLMLTVAVSYSTSKIFNQHTIYTKNLAEKGDLLTRHKDRNILLRMNVSNFLETNFEELSPDWTFGTLVKDIVTNSKRNIFPVTNEQHELVGIVLLDDIRDQLFNVEKHEAERVYDFMTVPIDTIEAGENMEKVMDKFERTNSWVLPVVKNGVYQGFVSKTKLFTAYRKILLEITEE
jgi:CIC family chloride channel protein